MHIGIIPMRSGSKRFKDKNKAILDGFPLWKRVVVKAVATMDMSYITTDYDDIKVCCNVACAVIERPEHLRDGSTYRIDDVLIDIVKTHNIPENAFLHLFQCTSPFTSIKTIEQCKKVLTSFENCDSVQSVVKIQNVFHEYSQREIIGEEIRFVNRVQRDKHYNSQKKPDRYAFAGYVACRVRSLLKHNNIWGNTSYPVIVDQYEAHDIDTETDLRHAQALIDSGIVV